MNTWAFGTFDSITNRRFTPPHPTAASAAVRTAHRIGRAVVIRVPPPFAHNGATIELGAYRRDADGSTGTESS
jgi:hypothetical protein